MLVYEFHCLQSCDRKNIILCPFLNLYMQFLYFSNLFYKFLVFHIFFNTNLFHIQFILEVIHHHYILEVVQESCIYID